LLGWEWLDKGGEDDVHERICSGELDEKGTLTDEEDWHHYL
jgi:hypothetical protein